HPFALEPVEVGAARAVVDEGSAGAGEAAGRVEHGAVAVGGAGLVAVEPLLDFLCDLVAGDHRQVVLVDHRSVPRGRGVAARAVAAAAEALDVAGGDGDEGE